MKQLWFVPLAAMFLAGPGLAQTGPLYDKPCIELLREMEHYYEGEDVRADPARTAGDPVSRIMDDLLMDVQGHAYLRIRAHFEQSFIDTCLRSQDAREDEAITVRRAIARVIDHYDLDPEVPRWGLIEIPELDVYAHSTADVQKAIDTMSHEEFRNPMNDPLQPALLMYFEKYDLSTRADFEAAGRVVIGLSYEASDQPMSIVLDRLSVEEGLKLE